MSYLVLEAIQRHLLIIVTDEVSEDAILPKPSSIDSTTATTEAESQPMQNRDQTQDSAIALDSEAMDFDPPVHQAPIPTAVSKDQGIGASEPVVQNTNSGAEGLTDSKLLHPL